MTAATSLRDKITAELLTTWDARRGVIAAPKTHCEALAAALMPIILNHFTATHADHVALQQMTDQRDYQMERARKANLRANNTRDNNHRLLAELEQARAAEATR